MHLRRHQLTSLIARKCIFIPSSHSFRGSEGVIYDQRVGSQWKFLKDRTEARHEDFEELPDCYVYL
jgi:hypothetical protein